MDIPTALYLLGMELAETAKDQKEREEGFVMIARAAAKDVIEAVMYLEGLQTLQEKGRPFSPDFLKTWIHASLSLRQATLVPTGLPEGPRFG